MILPDGRLAKVYHLRIYAAAANDQDPLDDDWSRKEVRRYSVRREGLVPLTKGGKTVVQVLDRYDQDHIVAEGIAYCNPTDNYNKNIGRLAALGRAMKQLNGKEES